MSKGKPSAHKAEVVPGSDEIGVGFDQEVRDVTRSKVHQDVS